MTMHRPFRLTDAMILIGAIAMGLSIVHEGARMARHSDYTGYLLSIPAPTWLLGPPRPGQLGAQRLVWVPFALQSHSSLLDRLMGAWILLGPCLVASSLATTALGFFPPRSTSRALWRQPCWLANTGALLALLATMIPPARLALQLRSSVWILDLFEHAIVLGPFLATCAILIAWGTLWLTRTAQPRASWLELLAMFHVLGYLTAALFLASFLLVRS